MVQFTPEQSRSAVEITQLVNLWANELDLNDGLSIAPLIAQDCVYVVRAEPRRGRDAVVQFYQQRMAELQASPSGPPFQRHIISNLVFQFGDAGVVGATFLLTYYAAFQAPPVAGFAGPVAVADCRMQFCLEEGGWKIAEFSSVQNFHRPIS
ncbi:nuclear transport factor 2 family protein [Haliea sp. E17]|uniref:nuclear transport factor 2 family protein n=1 Tax=Haliea sp. E17 TaxID=3401576 RepID=UPI003AAA946F